MNSIFLDTNVIVRLLIGDNKSQLKKVIKLFEKIEKGESKAIVSILVLAEVSWVCESVYDISRQDYLPVLLKILGYKSISCQEMTKSSMLEMLSGFGSTSVDFADYYLSYLSKKSGEKVVSFDKDFKKLVPKSRQYF